MPRFTQSPALRTLLPALTLALMQAGLLTAQAAPGAYYDPSNPASSSGRTTGAEQYSTIGCPGRGILDAPCKQPEPVTKAAPAPVVVVESQPAPVVEPAVAPKAAPAAVVVVEPAPAPIVVSSPASLDAGTRMATAPIMSEQVVSALIRDKNGNPVSNARVEWTLANAPGMVGDILRASVDAQRAASDFAVTRTDGKGEASITLTSPLEGITHILAYAPEVADPAANKAHLVRQWVDAAWRFPAGDPGAKVGGAQTLTTRLIKQSTGEPLPGQEVYWELLDGPEAYFADSRLPSAVTLTDDNGVASVQLLQTEPRGGTNTVAVEVSRPGDASATCCPLPTGTYAKGQAQATWLAPELTLSQTCPGSVHTNEAGKFSLTVNNPGKVGADGVTLQAALPAGMKVADAGGAELGDNTLTWHLGSLGAGASRTVGYSAQTSRVGVYGFGSTADSLEGLSASGNCNVNAVAAELSIAKVCPPEALVGDQVVYPVSISNKGSAEASNVLVKEVVPSGMKHASGQPVVEWKVGSLAPGATLTEKFSFTASQMGTQINTAKFSADRGLSGAAQCLTEVKKPAIDVEKSGPDKRFLGRPASYGIAASNPGNATATNVVVTDVVPVGMSFKEAGQGGSYDASTRTVSWKLKELAPGASAKMDVTLVGDQAGKPCNVATATADRGLTDNARACTEIAGIAALLLELVDDPDPVEVGARTVYTIRVTNQGSAEATNVAIKSMLAEGQELVSATGATPASGADGQVSFAPLASLAPGQVVEFKVEVKAVKASGDVRFRAMMTADQLTDAVREEESTRLY